MKRAFTFSAVILVAVGFFIFFFTPEDCSMQSPYNLSPACVTATTNRAIEDKSAEAMYNLALHYEGSDAEKSKYWVGLASHAGYSLAQARVLGDCGPGKMFSIADAEKVFGVKNTRRGNDALLYSMYFYLGGSCRPADIDRARGYYSSDINRGLMICPVSRAYAELVIKGNGNMVDRQNSVQLLTNCMNNVEKGSNSFETAETLLNKIR